MPVPTEIRGVVFERGAAVLLARVVQADGQPVSPSSIASIAYSIDERPGCDGAPKPVVGHQGVALTPSVVLFGSLQLSGEWSVDTTGFNFRHEIDVLTNDAFPTAGRAYTVRYELRPTAGQPIVIRFLLRAL